MAGSTGSGLFSANAVNQALTDNPSLNHTPGLALPVINSPDPASSAQTIAHSYGLTTTQQALQDNAAQVPNQSIWDKAFSGAGKVVMGSLNWLNKPLQQVQQDYKYLHSVYSKHGVLAGLTATTGILGGAVLGSLALPGFGTVAGADIAASLERWIGGHTFAPDSYADSTNPNYTASIGRDFAQGISQIPGLDSVGNTKKGWGKTISGLTDATFDMTTDPLLILGKARTVVRAGELLTKGVFDTTLVRRSMPGMQDFLQRNSLRIFSPDQMDLLWKSGAKGNKSLGDSLVGSPGAQYRRATGEIAELANSPEGAGAIVAKYPGLRGIATELAPKGAKNVTPQDVHDVFLRVSYDDSLMKQYAVNGQAMVPSRTVLRAAVSEVSDKLHQAGGNDAVYLKANEPGFFFPKKTQSATIQSVADSSGNLVPTIVNEADATWNTPVVFRAAKALVMPFSDDARKQLADGLKAAIAGKTRTFSGYMPYSIDTKTNELSTMKFDPNTPDAGQVVYRVARFSMGEKMARQKAAEFLYADPSMQKDTWLAIQGEMIKAAGLPNDTNLFRNSVDKIAQQVHQPMDRGALMGTGVVHGNDASLFNVGDATHSLALFEDQAGKFAIPDFSMLKQSMRELSRYGKMYGKFDTFAGRYIDKVFKPQALLTGGFALRVALSELIPQIFRFGSVDVARAKVAEAAASMGYKLIPGEDAKILANSLSALSEGTDAREYIANAVAQVEGHAVKKTIIKSLNKFASEKDTKLASQIAIVTQGHMATGMTLTGWGASGETQEFNRQLVGIAGEHKRVQVKPRGVYSWYTPNNPEFNLHFASQLHLSANTESRRLIVQDVLDEIKSGATPDAAWKTAELKDMARISKVQYDPSNPTFMGAPLAQGERDPLAKERSMLSAFNVVDPAVFANRRVDVMRNFFQGEAGHTNQELMQMIADGKTPSLEYLKGLDSKFVPSNVIGMQYEVAPPKGALEKIVQFGFEHVLDPTINSLSRQPLFFNHVKNEMASLEWAIEKGHLGEDEALRIAMSRASVAMLPQIHNTMLRTQFSVYAKNFMPFWFAQEQSMRRAGILITSHPYALRQYQQAQQALNDPGFVQTDSLGKKHVVLPGMGELGSSFINIASALGLPMVGGLPVTATGNLQSLRTVIPEFTMPGTSPFISIAVNTLESFDPTLARDLKVFGASGSRGLVDQLIPNAPMRNAFKALSPNEKESSFYNAMISSLASAQLYGQLPGADASPTEMQAFYDRIKNNARSILWMKTLLSTWSPLSPAVSQEVPGLRDEFYGLMKQKSIVTGKNNTFPEALGLFLAKHGNQSVSYTLGRSKSIVPGAMMPYTTEAIDWIERNQKLLNSKNGSAAAFLIPQVSTLSGDAQAIHDELIKMHLRENKTPQEFMNSMYIAAGNNYIYTQKPLHDAAMKQLKDAGESQTQERQNWSDFVQSYGKTNPIWEADYSSPIRTQNAVHVVQQLQTLYSSKNPPQGQQAALVGNLLRDWVNHAVQVQKLANDGSPESVQSEKDNWSNYLDGVVSKTPELNSVINSVFRRLT